MTLCACWMLVGLYLDGWAHRHIPNLETFFTPWHGVLYSGFLATFTLIGVMAWRNHARGWPWPESVPAGYELSLAGLLLFAAGGVGDLIWHTVFGIEADLDALLSPTHLILAVGGTLIGAAPFRAAWRRERPPQHFFGFLPLLLSLTFTLSVLTFFTQFAHSFVHPWAGGTEPPPQPYLRQALELAAILLQSAIFSGAILLAVWRWALPAGSLTVVFVLNSLLMTMLERQFSFVVVGLLAGLGADWLNQRLMPASRSPWRFRLFAGSVPALYYAVYFAWLKLTVGVWWSVHLWTGTIVMAGLVGWLMSYLLVPPFLPAGETSPGDRSD